jgi:hypothetical protein
MAFKLPPAQMALSPGDLVEGGVIKVTASPGLASIDARAEDLGAKVWLQVQQIIAMVRPDTLHVFTHGGPDAADESSRGLFTNRNYYYSALRRTASVDHFTETILPVNVAQGELSFLVEGVVTEAANTKLKFVKDVANDDASSWGTLITNQGIRGGHFPTTRLYIGFGFGLRKSVTDGLIVFNPIGLVRTISGVCPSSFLYLSV